ncbi:MAG: hypothetical protein WKF84_12415 [Pyrinomonadaceae bacterium]
MPHGAVVWAARACRRRLVRRTYFLTVMAGVVVVLLPAPLLSTATAVKT